MFSLQTPTHDGPFFADMFSLFSRPIRCEPQTSLPPQGQLPPHLRGPNPEKIVALPPTIPVNEKDWISFFAPFFAEAPPGGETPAAAFDVSNLYIVVAALVITTQAPKFLKVRSQQLKMAIILGTWTLASFLLVQNLNEKFWDAEKDNRLKLKEEELYRLRQDQAGATTSALYETGFGGQEGLKDKFATTSGEH